jgi:hypothetical protein
MKPLPKVGSHIFVVWFDDEIGKWQVDDRNIYAGMVALVRNKIVVIQDDLPVTESNLMFLNSKYVFNNKEQADAEAARLNKQA